MTDNADIAERIEELRELQTTSGWKILQEHLLAMSEVETSIVLRELDPRAAGAQAAYLNIALWPSREIARLRNSLTAAANLHTLTKGNTNA